MKIAVECKSPLLQKSLEIFLSRYLCSPKSCDIIVRDVELSDDKKTFYIAGNTKADLKKPFSKSQLILALENRYQLISPLLEVQEENTTNDEPLNFDILEKRINSLTQEYQQNIIKAVKAFYEK